MACDLHVVVVCELYECISRTKIKTIGTRSRVNQLPLHIVFSDNMIEMPFCQSDIHCNLFLCTTRDLSIRNRPIDGHTDSKRILEMIFQGHRRLDLIRWSGFDGFFFQWDKIRSHWFCCLIPHDKEHFLGIASSQFSQSIRSEMKSIGIGRNPGGRNNMRISQSLRESLHDLIHAGRRTVLIRVHHFSC